jgi:hypothetical protein
MLVADIMTLSVALTGAVADALTVPEYLQSTTVLALESSNLNRSTTLDEPMSAVIELKVVEHVLYSLLAKAPEAAFETNPSRGGELRWLMLRAPHEFSQPVVERTRRSGLRVVIVQTSEARWLAIEGTSSSEAALANNMWADFDLREKSRGGGGGGDGADSASKLTFVHAGIAALAEDVWNTLEAYCDLAEADAADADKSLEVPETPKPVCS